MSVLDRGSPSSSYECVEQRPGVLQVSRVKSLSEPVVDRRQQLLSLGPLAQPLPQPGEARGGVQFPRLGLLEAGRGLGGCVQDGLPRQQLPVQPMQLGFERTPSKREPLLPL